MVNWYCYASLCYNNHASETRSGKKVKFNRLPKGPSSSAKYESALKTDKINFKERHVCCKHWNRG